MAKFVAVTESVKNLSELDERFGLRRSEDASFFNEWQDDLPELSEAEQRSLHTLRRRLLYHRADGELLEGAVTLLVASPLLELAGFYDPPFKMRAEAAIELTIEDGDETLRGRIDVLIMQSRLWILVLESKKTTISTRSALPQVLAYMLANQLSQPTFGMLTNGDDVLFIKLSRQPDTICDLSRAFSLYTLPSEAQATLQILKRLGQTALQSPT
ncbi:MAG: type I restriction endonuclease subunit R [Leptolyngbyaceae cyanobacterium RU_5_1]|nr:type I restriction endonuclease subunit R [Leptolyngbyaceae cyanobacterium RU_5_1]